MSMSVNKNFTVNYPMNKMIQNVADYKVVHEQFLDSKTTLDNHIAECPVLLAVMIKMPWITKEEMVAAITQMGFVR